MDKTKRDFFISYNQADKQWAKWIAAVLEANGYTTWLQAWDFRPGSNFVLNMHQALLQSERFIAVLSADYLASLYCQAEWASAFTRDPNGEKRLFIPVRVADVTPEGLFAAVIYIDLFGTDEETAEKSLVQGVDVKSIPRNRPSFPGAPKVRFPGSLPFHNLPYKRNAYFTGREQTLKDIFTGFESGNAIALTQAITGLGGLGKTQTALEYAYRYAAKYEWIWWVPAESEASVLSAYKAFAVKMGLLERTQSDGELIVETVLNWMDTHSDWLFIYDNADCLSADTWWLPPNNRGNILLTTRYRHGYMGKPVDISVFSPEEAVSFLLKRAGLEDDAKARLLSERLGHLPLALEQAAAYIKINGSTYGGYLALLEEYGLAVLEEADGIIHYEKPLTATWAISLRQIHRPEARQLLNLCAYLASENLYAELFDANLGALPSPLQEALSNKLERNRVWRELTRYSLLEKRDGKWYSMHRLLQETVRHDLRGDPQWARCVLQMLYNAYDFSYEEQDAFLVNTLHVEAFTTAAAFPEEDGQKKMAHLCAEAGYGNYCLGIYAKALEWYRRALEKYEKTLGPEHPDTATTYNNIASVYESQGDTAEALEWYRKALAIRERVLGPEHPDTAETYNNIAFVYSRQGDYARALEWYQKALAIREKLLGPEHPDTATTYNNIASVYENRGDYAKALKLYQKAWAIREHALGPAHPDTAATYNNIAGVYFRQGDTAEALGWYQKALEIKEKVLGPEHPDTAATYNNIASVYDNRGDYAKALEWHQKALAVNEKMLGAEHPDTATTYNNIASVYDSQGDCAKALEWYRRALAIREKALGPEHPDTAATYNNIAFVYASQGNSAQALKGYQRASAICEKALGPEHPDTATTYNNIADVYESQGDNPKALEWYRKALAIQEKTLGPEHPATANTYNNIAGVYFHQGDTTQARAGFQKALEILERRLGNEHPDTITVRRNIEALQA